MKKLLDRIVSFAIDHIEAIGSAIIAVLFGWFLGFKNGAKRKEKQLLKTHQALRKLQAEYDALNAKDKKNNRARKKLEKQIGAYQSLIAKLEEELAEK